MCLKQLFKVVLAKLFLKMINIGGTDSDRAAKRMLDAAGVKYTKVPPISIEFK